jgi:hypothetical protein
MSKQPTMAQLRDDIDRGRTGDKVNVSDPAAAPLGTDEEAAGTPTSADAVRQARDYERAMGRKVQESREDTWGVSAIGIYVAIILALATLVSASIWLFSRP